MFSLNTLKQLAKAALWSGSLAGLLLTAAQLLPNLLYIDAQPHNNLEHATYKAISNIGQGIVFALLLGSTMNLKSRPANCYIGLLWGLAGYLTFFVAPSMALPSGLPDTEAVSFADRQNRWLIAVFDTGFGLSLLAFAKTRTNKFFGAVLLVTPRLLSSPNAEIAGSTVPAELAQSFIAAAIANAVFWLAIGGLMGRFYNKDLPN